MENRRRVEDSGELQTLQVLIQLDTLFNLFNILLFNIYSICSDEALVVAFCLSLI